MIFSYYPGCTLKNKAQDLDRYARASAEKLGVTLQELENWQCCGGAFSMGKVEIGGRIYEAKSTDVYIDQRSTVEVVGFENFNVVVRKVADEPSV